MGIGRHTGADACRAVEHPGRNFKPTISAQTAQAAAKYNAIRFVDRIVNADPKPVPRMPGIQDFAKLGSVGVLKPCCTMPTDL
ncbi:MAG: hypothetical protein WB624_23060, partial [Xanthobacteraceae bacterium]